MLWVEYALSNVDDLSPGAVRLRAALLERIEEVAA
jgi:hypothetical protein